MRKRISDKKWIAGGIVVLDPDSDYVFISEPYYYASTLPVRELIYDRTHLVDKETVCQYTGLTDKNGKKIFEGDIIRDIDYGLMRCIYLHGSFVWFNDDKFRWIELRKHITKEEIIGNIFDNPDLITSEKGADA